ncbi:hypothetical protein DFJ73DRAFT_757209 [Zopfochytrium polystomum]|nr:hypothetical protein DFJ73DRAFT_757209 [Zopfochytrium polystomum]
MSTPAAAAAPIVKHARSRLITAFNFCSRIPFIGRLLFSALLGFFSPYTGTLPLRVTHLSPGHCRAAMTETRSLRNPFRSVHAAALINFGEAVGGLAVMSWLEAVGAVKGGRWEHLRGIPVRLEGQFLKKARGTLVTDVVCNPGLVAESWKDGVKEGNMDVVAKIVDATGQVVCNVVATWSLRNK